MKNIPKRLQAMLLALCCTVAAWADVPFTPTTIQNGEFAEGTKWYFMQITSSKYYVTDNGTADRITLTSRSYGDAPELWCFVADEDGSYKIYNKATGTAKVLASSSTMTGTTGSTTYPTLQPVDQMPAGYVDTWDFSSSTNISGVNGQYIALHGHASAKMNNRGGVLAFWTGGQDAGSTFTFTPEKGVEATISLATGSFNSGGSYKNTWSSSVFSDLTLTASANNMIADNTDATLISSYSGKSNSSTLTITAPAGWLIKSYSLDYALRSDNPTATETINGTTATTTPQTLQVDDCNAQTVSFTQAGNNKAVTFSNFKVVMDRVAFPREDYYEVFVTPGSGTPYRIPAIAQATNGDLIAVADYRYSKQDIGMATNGKLDLRFRISKDNGQTWGAVGTLVAGQGADALVEGDEDTNKMWVAFGDPCIVVDRESGKVLVMSCAGNVSYLAGTREKHQYIVTMYSEDNGQTWSQPVDVAEAIYTKFDESTVGTPASMFVGSGKISQSKYIKVKDYYRIYCAVLYKDVNGVAKNYVLYSDDFGKTWDVLGGVDAPAIPGNTNEPKADELPDGSVVCSGRINGGRQFNIFHYIDPIKAEGAWGTSHNATTAANGPVDGSSQGTNGEILTVPVKRVEDGKKMYLCLQSVPLGPNRSNVAIYYKALESLDDFNTAEHLATNWDGHYQACYFSSAYSTMTWLKNNTLAFLYEEDLHGQAYSIVYKNYTIDKLTDGAYTYCDDVKGSEFFKEQMDVHMEQAEAYRGPYVGNLTSQSYRKIRLAYEAFMKASSMLEYTAFNKAVADAQYRTLQPGVEYRVRNRNYTNHYLTLQSTALTSVPLSDDLAAAQKLTFSAGTVTGSWKVKGDATWLGSTGAAEADFVDVTTVENEAVDYKVVSDPTGWSYFRCLDPGNGTYPDLHDKNKSSNGYDYKVVRWEYTAQASQWYIEPILTDPTEKIEAVFCDCKDDLAPAGKVGYPALGNEKTTTFQEELDAVLVKLNDGTATQADYDALVAARAAYKNETSVVLPQDGKAYTITSVNINGVKRYMNYTEAGYEVVARTEGAKLPSTAVLICRDLGGGKYAFTNSEGKYFTWKGGSGTGYNENKGYTDTFDEQDNSYTVLTVEKLDDTPDNVTVSQEELFGYLTMKGRRYNKNETDYFVVKTAGNYDHASVPYFNSGFTSALLIEEVPDFRNKITFTKLNDEEHYVATYSAPYPTVLPEGVEAYEVINAGDGVAQTVRLQGEGTAIPAGKGVLLAATESIEPQYMAPATGETALTVSDDNLLTGTMGASVVLNNVYILANAANGVGFYNVKNGTSLGAFRAYLDVPVTAEAKSLRLSFGDEDGELTGIEGVAAETPAVRNQKIYDLSGRVVRNPQKGGLYIKGGKKFIQK